MIKSFLEIALFSKLFAKESLVVLVGVLVVWDSQFEKKTFSLINQERSVTDESISEYFSLL